MRFLFLLLAAGWLHQPAAAQAPTPPPASEAATLVGTYRLTYQPDSTNPAPRSEIMYLLLGKTLSQFHSQGTQAVDSLITVMDKLPFNQETATITLTQFELLPHSRFHYNIYKTTAPRCVYCYDNIGLQHYRYEEPADVFIWTITPATATVAGYACQRATATFGGRQWEAWFTREVPVSDGPYKFCGLPGLIVKVGDTRQRYVFELLKLAKPATERRIMVPTRAAAATDKAAFRRAKNDYDTNPMGYLAPARNGGAGVYSTDGSSSEQMQQRAREVARKRNNPLELK